MLVIIHFEKVYHHVYFNLRGCTRYSCPCA